MAKKEQQPKCVQCGRTSGLMVAAIQDKKELMCLNCIAEMARPAPKSENGEELPWHQYIEGVQ